MYYPPEWPLEGLGAVDFYPNGVLRGAVLTEPNRVHLPIGEYTPNYHYDSPRSKHAPSISFFPSAKVKSVRFDRSEDIRLPSGMVVAAEKLSFYESGRIKKVFPLDGGLSGYWSEEDERTLAKKMDLTFSFGKLSLLVSALAFYETGQIRSVTLWSGEKLDISVGGTEYPVRIGFSLDPFGRVTSLEPQVPVKVSTPLGVLEAFDPFAIGLSADSNSLKFNEKGEVLALRSLIELRYGPDYSQRIAPFSKPHPLDDFKTHFYPLSLTFTDDELRVTRDGDHSGEEFYLSLKDPIKVEPFIRNKFARLVIPDGMGGLSLGL
jgi:hypothetical protein